MGITVINSHNYLFGKSFNEDESIKFYPLSFSPYNLSFEINNLLGARNSSRFQTKYARRCDKKPLAMPIAIIIPIGVYKPHTFLELFLFLYHF